MYSQDRKSSLELNLNCISAARTVKATFTKSPKIVLSLNNWETHIKLSFRRGGEVQFYNTMMDSLAKKKWLQKE